MAAFPGGEFAAAVRALRSCPERIGKERMLAVVGRRDDERVVGEIQAVERVQNLRETLGLCEICRRAYASNRPGRLLKVKSRVGGFTRRGTPPIISSTSAIVSR